MCSLTIPQYYRNMFTLNEQGNTNEKEAGLVEEKRQSGPGMRGEAEVKRRSLSRSV